MRGFLKINFAALGAIATVGRDLLNHAHVVQISSLRDFVTLFQCLRIACTQYFCDKNRYFVLKIRIHANRVAGGEHQTVAVQLDFRPEHARRIGQNHVAG